MHVTGFVTVALAVALVTRCFAEVEVNSGVYLERLPAVNLYEASSPLLFYVNLTKLINVYCPVPCNVVMCDVLRKPEFIPFTMQPQETDGSILENDGQEETYQLVNKAHVKRLFTNEKELQKLQEQLRIRNITWREVSLPMGFTRQPVSLCEACAEAWIEPLFVKSLVSNLLQMCQTKKMRPLAEHCPPRCQETGQDVQYVTPLADNQFLITHPPRNLSVTCNGQQSSLRN
jgi:hypothetical protein